MQRKVNFKTLKKIAFLTLLSRCSTFAVVEQMDGDDNVNFYSLLHFG